MPVDDITSRTEPVVSNAMAGCPTVGGCDWPFVGYHVMEEIKRIAILIEKIDGKVAKGFIESNERFVLLNTEVTKLKIISALWGAAGGIVFSAITTIVVTKFLL